MNMVNHPVYFKPISGIPKPARPLVIELPDDRILKQIDLNTDMDFLEFNLTLQNQDGPDWKVSFCINMPLYRQHPKIVLLEYNKWAKRLAMVWVNKGATNTQADY
jgi:hypothetical protein